MPILYRFVLRHWLQALVMSLLSLLLMISVADIINGFLRGKDASLVLLEYLLKFPDFMIKFLPLTGLLASLFSLQKMKTHSELIATLASGMNIRHYFILFTLASLPLFFLQFLNVGFIEPYANKVKRQEIKKSQLSEGKFLTRSNLDGGDYWFKAEGYFGTFTLFDKNTATLINPQIYFVTENSELTQVLKAQQAQFQNDSWIFKNGDISEQLELKKIPVTKKFQKLKVNIFQTPQDFSEFEADLTTLNWFNLRRFIDRVSQTGVNTAEYKVMLHQKVALCFMCFIFTLLPLFSLYNPNKRSDSFGKTAAISLLLGIGFWVSFSGLITLGQKGSLHPLFSAYFLLLASFVALFLWHKKHQSL
jgi:lipopolysaccharide export system permease protein